MKRENVSVKKYNGIVAGVLVVLMLIIAILFGVSTTNAAAASSWSCSATYVSSSNSVRLNYRYSGTTSLSFPIQVSVRFAGEKSFSKFFSVDVSKGTGLIPIDGDSNFVAGNEYTVSVTIMDSYAAEMGMLEDPHYASFPNICTFTVPGGSLPLPEEPVQEGYHFVGWYYDEALTQPYDGEPLNEETTLYPKMEINTYTVTFDTQGGNKIYSVTIDWNESFPLPNDPVKEGYTFSGWYNEDGTPYVHTVVTEDIILYAHWSANTYTVTFYFENAVYTTIQVEHGKVLI